jgi:hypothetical protein
VPAEWAGKKTRCKKCQATISIAGAAVLEPEADEDVVDDGFEVVDDAKPQKTKVARDADDVQDQERDGEKRKRKRRPKRELTNEERAEREADRRFEEERRKRGGVYLASGIATMLIGGGTIWLMVSLKAEMGEDNATGILRTLYKIGPAWLPGLLLIVAGLFPLTLGILNLMGISIVVTERDDD